MRTTIYIPLIAGILISLISCSKQDGIKLQAHDANRMMDSLHAMMNRMQAMPPTNDPDIDFPKMMIMHHQGAINTAQVQLQDGKNDSLKRFSQKIIADQQMEIQEMTSILAGEVVNNNVPPFTMKQMDNMMKMDQMADVQLITGDLDNDFATLMIMHHNSAIENAGSYLMYGNNQKLKDMAQKMIDAQQKEIRELSDWLKSNKR